VSHDAFISYSHETDADLAPALRTGLHRFAKPWWRRRAVNVFCDTNNLSASPELWGSIEDALRGSRHLIVLAAPEAAASRWTGREIESWTELHGSENLHLALTGGELVWNDDADDFDAVRSTALHPSLRGVFAAEPLWVDLRDVKAKSNWSIRNSDFAMAVARLAAPIRGTSPGELIGDDLRFHRRALRLGISAALFISILAFVALAAAFTVLRLNDDVDSLKTERTGLRDDVAKTENDLVTGLLAADAKQSMLAGNLERAMLQSVAATKAGPDDAWAVRSLSETTEAAQGLSGSLRIPGADAPGNWSAVAATSDGSRVAAAEVNSEISEGEMSARLYLWDGANTGRPVAVQLRADDGALACFEELGFDSSGRWLVTVEAEGGCLNDVTNTVVTELLSSALGGVDDLKFVRRVVRVWDLADPLDPKLALVDRCATSTLVSSPVEFSSDRTMIVVQGGATLDLQDVGKDGCDTIPEARVSGADDTIYRGSIVYGFATDQSSATISYGPTIAHHSLFGEPSFDDTGRLVRGFQIHRTENTITAVAAAADSQSQIREFDHNGRVDVAFDPTGTVAAQITENATVVRFFDPRSGAPLNGRIPVDQPDEACRFEFGAVSMIDREGVIVDVAGVAIDANEAIVCPRRLYRYVRDGEGSRMIWRLDNMPFGVLERSPTRRYVTVASLDDSNDATFESHDIWIYSAETGTFVDVVHGDRLVGWSADDEFIVTEQMEFEADLQSLESWVWHVDEYGAVAVEAASGAAAKLSPDETSLVLLRASNFGTVLVPEDIPVVALTFVEGVAIRRELPGVSQLHSIAFSDHGRFAAFGAMNSGLQYDLTATSHEVVAVWPDADAQPLSVDPSDTATVARADEHRVETIRKGHSPELVYTDAPDNRIDWIQYSPTGDHIFVNSVLPSSELQCDVVDARRAERPLLELGTGEECRAFSGDGNRILTAELAPDGGATAIRVYDIRGSTEGPWTLDADLPDDSQDFSQDIFALDHIGDRIAGTNGTGTSRVWERATNDLIHDESPDVQTSDLPLAGIAFNRKGNLATVAPDAIIRLYDLDRVRGDQQVAASDPISAIDHDGRAARLRFSPDGAMLLIDGIYLFDADTLARMSVRLHPGHWNRFGFAASDQLPDTGTAATGFSTDGRFVYAIRTDYSEVVRWDISVDSMIARACRLVRRAPTVAEVTSRELRSRVCPQPDTPTRVPVGVASAPDAVDAVIEG
jgi:WD40 repeat protein